MNITALQASFQPLASRQEELSDRFHELLFGASPDLQNLFAETDLETQGRRLFQILALVAKEADRPQALASALAPLARRHFRYGVQPGHYALVRRTLLAAMARVGGEDWTKEAADAWEEALRWVTDLMVGIHCQEKTRTSSAP